MHLINLKGKMCKINIINPDYLFTLQSNHAQKGIFFVIGTGRFTHRASIYTRKKNVENGIVYCPTLSCCIAVEVSEF